MSHKVTLISTLLYDEGFIAREIINFILKIKYLPIYEESTKRITKSNI